MEHQMRLALRNWRETGDARFAIQFTSLFERSNIPTQPLSDDQELFLFVYKILQDNVGEFYSIHQTMDDAYAEAGLVILERLDDEGEESDDVSEIINLVRDGNIELAIEAFNNFHYAIELEIAPVRL